MKNSFEEGKMEINREELFFFKWELKVGHLRFYIQWLIMNNANKVEGYSKWIE
jgi:hypothetical protein